MTDSDEESEQDVSAEPEFERHEEYMGHPLYDEYNKLSVTVNNQEFLLSSELLSHIEEKAERKFENNDYVNYSWRLGEPDEDEHGSGDPILVIETKGATVPWDNLSEMEIEMQQIDPMRMPDDMQSQDDGSDDHDNGNGTMGKPPRGEGENNNDGIDDFKLQMFPQEYRPVPDADDDKFETLPPAPEEFPGEEPELVLPLPNLNREERWDVGEAMVAVDTVVEWNVQNRIDSTIDGATKADGKTEKTNSHDEWEGILRHFDCEGIGEMQPSNKPNANESSGEAERKPWDYETKDDGTVRDGDVGDRWHL